MSASAFSIVKTSVGLAAAGGLASIALAAPLLANAATPSPTPSLSTTSASGSSTGSAPAPRGGETALSGETAQKVAAAALAAVPGATVRRVTTEHPGVSNSYEAHLTKSDGTRVTALVSSTFTVLSVESDPGRR